MEFYEFDRNDAFRFANFIGISTRVKGKDLLFTTCPYCHSTKDKERFAINLNTGQFNCLRASCGMKGNMLTLSRDFGFQISEDVDRYLNRSNYNGRFRKFKADHKKSTDAAIQYMESRGISKEVCQKYEITSRKDDKNIIAFPFYDDKGNLRFIKYRNTEYKKGDKGSKEWCERDCMPILFGMNHCEAGGQLIITEGQIDSLSVAEAGYTNAVSVPLGMNATTWVPHCYDWVHRFNEIVVFGDCENDRITLVDIITSRFKTITVKIVKVDDYQGCKDANEILRAYGKDAVRKAIENAEPILNKKIKCMDEVRAVDLDKIPKISSGFKTLDKTLKGGFMFGQVILLTGKRGNGKSTCGSMFVAEALAQNYNCLVYSGELPDFFVKAWLDGQIYGKDVLTNSEISEVERYYHDRLFIYNNQFVDDDELEDLPSIVEDTVIKKDIKFVLIDNLMTAITADTNEFLYRKQSEFVGRLARMAKQFEIVIMLIAHPRKSKQEFENDDVSGSADITNRVDVVMSYDVPPKEDRPEENERYLKVTKNRLTGRLGSVPLFYSDSSKRISEDNNNFSKNYLPDSEWQQASEDLEEIPYYVGGEEL